MIKTLITTSMLAFSQVNFSHTPLQPQRQESASTSIVSNGIVDYELTLEPSAQINNGTSYSKSYKNTYNEQFTYLNVQGEDILYNYYKKQNETYNNLPSSWSMMATRPTNYPYIKIANTTGELEQTYNYTQELTMLQVTPYYSNIDNQINDTFKLNVLTTALVYENIALNNNPFYTQYTIQKTEYYVDLFTSTYDWSTYMGAATWYTDHYINGIYEDLYQLQTGYNTTHRQIIVERTNLTQEIEITFNLIQEKINYLFLFITPIITLTENLDTYSIAHISCSNIGSQGTQQIKIIGTGIVPTTTTEVVDIPNIMFTILGMPWYFISTAFNLTLFTGTPYQINISNLFLAFISVLVFVFILRLLTKQR